MTLTQYHQMTTSNPLSPSSPQKSITFFENIVFPFILFYFTLPEVSISPLFNNLLTCPFHPAPHPTQPPLPALPLPSLTQLASAMLPENLSHSSCLNSTHRLMVPNLFLQPTCLLWTLTQICHFLMDFFTWIIHWHFQLTVTKVELIV